MGAAALAAYVAFTCLAASLPFHEWAIDRVERAPLKVAQNGLNCDRGTTLGPSI
jgi:hypothetical protein